MAIRDAVIADAPLVAELHTAVWHETYRDLAPPEARQVLDLAFRQSRWADMLRTPASEALTLVDDTNGVVRGFVHAEPSSSPLFQGRPEIKLLYVASAFHGHGLGKALVRAMSQRLAEQGSKGFGLCVVEGNDQAIAFYERLGGRRAGTLIDPGPIWRSSNIAYVWDGPLTE
jgi:ribosomal protein S18 acetylase RimI-like enzyme